MPVIIANIRKWFENSSKKQKLVASLFAFSLLATAAVFSLVNPSNVSADPLDSTPFYFISAIVKLMVVLLLIVGSSIVFRRWLQGNPGRKAVQQMRLMETIRLSPKQSLHLIVIGDQKLLIGATDQNVSLISPIEMEDLGPVSIEESQPQPGVDFGSMIRSFNLDFSTVRVKGKE